MSFLLVGAAAVGVGAGVAQAIGGSKRKKAAEAEAKIAKAEIEQRKNQFEQLDTSNPFANMENKMEDLAVNQQEAEFIKAQQQQNQANILNQMKGSAGSSGIAALAQTLANQGSIDSQKAAISIGQQEQANQQLERQAASQIQSQERQGEIMSRDMERNKVSNLMAMASADLEAANMKEQAANDQMWGGITNAASSVASLASPAPMKSPLKAVDTGLISAYRAGALSGVDQKAGTRADGLVDVAKSFAKDIKTKREETKKENAAAKKEGQELSQGVLDTAGALGDNYFDAFTTNITAMQGDYDQAVLDGDKELQAKLQGQMNTYAAETANLKDLRMDVAKTFDTQSVDGKESPNLIKNLDAETQKILKAVIDPSTKVSTKMVDGKVVTTFNVNGKEYTKNEIEQKLYDSKEDVVTINSIQKVRDGIKAKALEDVAISSGDGDNNFTADFENMRKDTRNQVQKTIRDGNLVSLMNDDVLGNGRNFVDDLLDSNMFTYEGLGLKGIEDDDGKISREEFEKLSEEDQAALMDALTNRENPNFNEDTLVDMMSNYIVSDFENQYNRMIGRGTAAEDKQLGYAQNVPTGSDGTVDYDAILENIQKES
tara:strand:- start:331 stop:2136 length:1806 start_codon:yes stop_codon:yes gene_type:complete